MKIRINEKDIKLIFFLGRYKKIKAIDCKRLYKSKDYYRKRLKVLEKAKYIKREKRIIKIDIEGREMLRRFGRESYNFCRNKEYQDRIDNVTKIALLALGTKMEFTPSWEIKDKEIHTDYGKKYLGQLKYSEDETYIVYYISEKNVSLYTKQVLRDVEMLDDKKRVIIFLEDYKYLSKTVRYFTTGKKSTQIIVPTEQNLELIEFFEDTYTYCIVNMIYDNREVSGSEWDKADFVTKDDTYIVWLPFIDVEKLHRLNCLDNSEKGVILDILTLKENVKKVKEILDYDFNIIELDSWLEEYKENREQYEWMLF